MVVNFKGKNNPFYGKKHSGEKMVMIKCQKCGFHVGNLTRKDTIRCCKCGFENPKKTDKKEKKED